MTTFNRLKKIIEKGIFDSEEMKLDLTGFLELHTITEEEHKELLSIMERTPALFNNVYINEADNIVSNNTYLLLKKQIDNKVYDVNVIEQYVTDFKITNSITREQFNDLLSSIQEIYYPVEDNLIEFLPI